MIKKLIISLALLAGVISVDAKTTCFNKDGVINCQQEQTTPAPDTDELDLYGKAWNRNLKYYYCPKDPKGFKHIVAFHKGSGMAGMCFDGGAAFNKCCKWCTWAGFKKFGCPAAFFKDNCGHC